MRDYKSLTHRRWDCNYHIVFIPNKPPAMPEVI